MKKLVAVAMCGALVAAFPMVASAEGTWEKTDSPYGYVAEADNGKNGVEVKTSYNVFRMEAGDVYSDLITEKDIVVDGKTYTSVNIPKELDGETVNAYVYVRSDDERDEYGLLPGEVAFFGVEKDGEVYAFAFYSEGSTLLAYDEPKPEVTPDPEPTTVITEEEEEDDTNKAAPGPKTGDATPVGAMAAVAVVAAGCAVVAGKKLKKA